VGLQPRGPDNRRPVDYARRRELLAGLDARQDGRVKLCVHAAGLRARRYNAGLFSAGDYTPLTAAGEKAAHLFAFMRSSQAAGRSPRCRAS
jgi:(1->4)-alpha-D-glucan 1-alpha-D-glucosylmutase